MFSFLCAEESGSKAGNLFGYPAVGNILHRNEVKVRPFVTNLAARERHSLKRSVMSCVRRSMTLKKSFECQSTPTNSQGKLATLVEITESVKKPYSSRD
jgi:hypothetical protein